MEFKTATKKEWKEYCNRICKCGHRSGEHSRAGGCSHELEIPRRKGKYVQDLFCNCKGFVLVGTDVGGSK